MDGSDGLFTVAGAQFCTPRATFRRCTPLAVPRAARTWEWWVLQGSGRYQTPNPSHV